MAGIKPAHDPVLLELSKKLEVIKAEISERTGTQKPNDLAVESLQLNHLQKEWGFSEDYELDANCARKGIDSTGENLDFLQLKNCGQGPWYDGGYYSPLDVIAEKAVKEDKNAILVFTYMKNGDVVDCVVGPAKNVLNCKGPRGGRVQKIEFNDLAEKYGFERKTKC